LRENTHKRQPEKTAIIHNRGCQNRGCQLLLPRFPDDTIHFCEQLKSDALKLPSSLRQLLVPFPKRLKLRSWRAKFKKGEIISQSEYDDLIPEETETIRFPRKRIRIDVALFMEFEHV
jgi:5-methyltetrahydropteroyltriglutamate--homocysteine methyltransferase